MVFSESVSESKKQFDPGSHSGNQLRSPCDSLLQSSHPSVNIVATDKHHEYLPQGGMPMHFQELAQGLGLELDEFTALVALFIETSRADVDRMVTAVENADADRVKELAHSIKGSSGNLGFSEVAMAARQLEMKARDNNLASALELLQILNEKLDLIDQTLSTYPIL